MIQSIVVVFRLDQPNLLSVEFTIGSNSPNADVIPANRIAKNNNGANIRPIVPMILKIIGNTINISPVPSVINCTIGVPVVYDLNPILKKLQKQYKLQMQNLRQRQEIHCLLVWNFQVDNLHK